MMVSGFGMCCGYYQKIVNQKISVEDFYKKRYIKIWPYFALLCALDFVISPSKEECHSDLVSEVQRERVLPEVIFLSFCDLTYSVPNPVKPSVVDESFIRCYGRLGHLGDRERRAETDHRVYRERNHDGAGHAENYRKDPEGYENVIAQFVEEHSGVKENPAHL